MRLQVLMPQLESNLPRGVVVKWHVGVNEPCEFGQPLCDLNISERIRINQVRRADALIRLSRRKGKVVETTETEKERFVVTYQVVASEAATILRHAVAEGGEIEVGQLLAVADSDATPIPTNTDEDITSAPAMRVIARLYEADSESD